MYYYAVTGIPKGVFEPCGNTRTIIGEIASDGREQGVTLTSSGVALYSSG
jgi:hypothetical protein